MDSLEIKSFVPARLVERVTADPRRCCDHRFEGVALFADISGFVKITEHFCRSGERGLEQLSSLLDASFCRYIEIVDRHGGEVAYLAGDGLLAYWSMDHHFRSEVCAASVACALDLCRIAQTEETARTVNPNLHLGLAAGKLWVAKVGGVDERWELLLGGEAMRRAAIAESLGGPREVIVASELVAQLGDRLSVIAKSEGFHHIRGLDAAAPSSALRSSGVSLDVDTVRALVPRAVVEHAGGRTRNWWAELRPVSVLFVRIDGLDEAREDALSRFHAASCAIHDTIRIYSSSTGRLMIDDKGLVFHVVFGSPFNSHSDDAARAAEAALALEDRLRSIGLDCSAGLAFGQAFCGVIGNGSRREYVTIGRPMNIAARLMAASSGELLCADGYPELRHAGIELFSARTLRPKGVDGKLQTYRLRRKEPTASPRGVIGRSDEQKALEDHLEELSRGRGNVLMIVGDAGLGKSRLLEQTRHRAAERGIEVARGQADAAVGSTYQAWRGVFRTVFGIQGSQSSEELRARALRRLSSSPKLIPLAPLLKVVLPLDIEESDVTRHLSGQLRADVTQRFLLDCLEEVAPKPMLIVLEDGHWMDSPSWRLAELAAKQLCGVLLVVALRPMPSRPELASIQQAGAAVLRLAPLERPEIRALVAETLGPHPVADDVADAVHRHTSGNPLFAQEYALLLREVGRIRIRDGSYRFSEHNRDLSNLEVPSTVQGTITSRLDHLDPVERLVLKVASVLGHSFDTELLERTYPVQGDKHHIPRVLESLCRRQLVEKSDTEAHRHVFHHVLIREVAYKLMLHEQRTALHRSVAYALEEAPSCSKRDYALLAHHWAVAGDRERTRRFGSLAAEHALETGAYSEAITLLERCLLEPDGVPSAVLVRFRRQLADAYAGLGKVTERDELARLALETAVRPPRNRRGIVTAESLLRVLRHGIGQTAPGPPAATDRDLELELAKVHRHRSEVCYYRSDAVGLSCELLAAIAHAQRYGPCADLVAAYAQFGGSFAIARLHGPARRLLRLSIRVAEELEDPLALAYAHMISALYSVGVADWARLERSVAICQDVCLRLDDPINWCNAQVISFWAHHYRGKVHRSGSLAGELLRKAEQIGNVQRIGWGLRTLAVYELSCGRFEESLRHAQRAAELNSGSSQANEIVAANGTLALAYLRTGDFRSACTAALVALEAGSDIRRPTAHSTLAGWSGVTEVLLDAVARNQRDPYWSGMARRALSALERHARSFPVAEPTYRYFRGSYESLRTKGHGADRSFRAGLDAARRLGVELDRQRLVDALRRENDERPVRA